jgi:hypothetical protein
MSNGRLRWQTILARADELYAPDAGLTNNNFTNAPRIGNEKTTTLLTDEAYCRSITNGFTYRPQEAEEEHLRFQEVEALLAQASVLLERCLADRSRYDDLAEKAFRNWLELEELEQLRRIHDEEIASAFYELPKKQAEAERDVHAQLEEDLSASKEHREDVTSVILMMRGKSDRSLAAAGLLKSRTNRAPSGVTMAPLS